MIETCLLKNVVIFIQTICDFLPNRNNIQPPRNLAQLSIWMSEIGILDTVKSSKNKMDSKVIKYHQCSPEKSHTVSIKLNSELYSRPDSF